MANAANFPAFSIISTNYIVKDQIGDRPKSIFLNEDGIMN